MEDPGTAETLAAFKDTRSQELDVREEETKCKETSHVFSLNQVHLLLLFRAVKQILREK